MVDNERENGFRRTLAASYGKLRGIQQIVNPVGVITMIALDHRAALAQSIQQHNLQRKVSFQDIVAEKLRMVRVLAPYASAVLLDPNYGVAQAIASHSIPGNVGLVVALESVQYSGSNDARLAHATDGWSVAKIKRLGASAVKLMVDYHPEARTAGQIEDFVEQVAEACYRYDIALILEPVSYPIHPDWTKDSIEFAREKPEIVLESVRRLGSLGADLLKLEFPDNPRHEHNEALMHMHCRALSEGSPVPWVILSAAEPFEVFQKMVGIACSEGATGFLAGRSIWQDVLMISNEKERDKALHSIALSRLEILTAIATHQACPYALSSTYLHTGEGWHHDYEELEH